MDSTAQSVRRDADYLFSVLPASCWQNETMRDRKTCRRDAGSILERHHEAPLNSYDAEQSDPLVLLVTTTTLKAKLRLATLVLVVVAMIAAIKYFGLQELINYAFGLTRVSLRDYVFASWIGMLPGTVMYVYIGSLIGHLRKLGSAGRQKTSIRWSPYSVAFLAT